MDTENQNAREDFIRELRKLLPQLYNPGAVRHSPLVSLFQFENRRDPPSALQQLVIKAIEALEPSAEYPVSSKAWRVFQVLHARYIDQFSQEEVARDLFLSARQLRRLELNAVEELAGYLWDAHRLDEKFSMTADQTPGASETAPAGISGPSGQEEELAWLERTLTSEVVDCSGLLESVIQTAQPLIKKLNTRIELACDPDIPPVTVQDTAVRQALLHTITIAANYAGEGTVKVSTELPPNRLFLRLRISAHTPNEVQIGKQFRAAQPEGLGMAEKLIQLSKGTFKTSFGMQKDIPFSVTIDLPTAEQVSVLVVDDNIDTLRLIERYLSNTRYQFFGVSNPNETLPTAVRVHPSIIILDVMLPDVDGWDMLGRLRTHPNTQDIPVIMCTILPQAQLALTLGAADFLKKPIRRDQLLSSLDRLAGLASLVSD